MIESYVEALAGALHTGAGLDNQSTTTAAYNARNHTLYVTSQMNRDYRAVLEQAPRAPRKLRMVSGQDLLWERQIPAVPEARLQPRDYGLGGFRKIAPHAHLTTWMEGAAEELEKQQNFDLDDFLGFVEGVHHVKVVLNQDLFVTGAITTSGLHGESRIIRYHLLKFIRNFEPLRFETLHAMKAADLIAELRTQFVQRYGSQLYFGSSQGACAYCAAFMAEWGIKFKGKQSLNKDRDETWKHPVTLSTKAQDFGFGIVSTVRVDAAGKWVRERREEARAVRNANASSSSGSDSNSNSKQ